MSLIVKLKVDTSRLNLSSRSVQPAQVPKSSRDSSTAFRQLLPLPVLIQRITETMMRPDIISPAASYAAGSHNGTTSANSSPSPISNTSVNNDEQDESSPSPASNASVRNNELDISLPSSTSDAPAINIGQPAQTDYLYQYDAIAEYVGNLRSGTRLLICRDTSLQQHMEGLEDAARDNNGFVFRLMKRSVNRDLSKAGFATLPDM